MKLITAQYCPFCLRCLLALTEKGLHFEVEEVHLPDKAQFPEKLSPYGRVPVLVDGTATIFESSVICEYLEDAYPTPALMPQSPATRARARFWIDFCNTRFMPAYFNLLKAPPGTEREDLRAELLTHLARINDDALPAETGPLWFGHHLTLTDIAFYPFFERFAAVEEFRGVVIAPDHENLHRWLNAMRARTSVRHYMRPRTEDVAYFAPYYADDETR
jgi:glutathione S-transferase